jgi:hypothetical protein
MGKASIHRFRIGIKLGPVCRTLDFSCVVLEPHFDVHNNGLVKQKIEENRMSVKAWHIIALVVIGYALGYWMPKVGDMTLGKIYARTS